MTKFKKTIAVILSTVMAITLSSCSKEITIDPEFKETIDSKFEEAIDSVFEGAVKLFGVIVDFLVGDTESEKTNAELVLQYIQEKNTDAIYDMLCEKLQETPDIKEQIEQTFDFIEGDVISYEKVYMSGDGAWADGKAKKDLLRACNSIKTTSGNIYDLVLQYYDENDFEPELVGIYNIYLYEINQDSSDDKLYLKELNIECQH